MKKLMGLALMAATITACNNGTDTTTTGTTTTDSATTTTTTTTSTNSSNAYRPAEGDVSYRNGKVVVWRGNDWVESDKDVTLDNGVVVRRDGKVQRDRDIIELNEGEVVNRTGNFFDKAGNAIENAWDKTKQGARKVGNAIEEGAEKVGDKTKEVFDGDNRRDSN